MTPAKPSDNKVQADKEFTSFSRDYFKSLGCLLDSLDTDAIAAFIGQLKDAREKGGSVFFIGNGGSAATASHMANDFGVNLFSKRNDLKPIRAFSLTDNSPVMLAVSNDEGYENLFISQLKVLFKQGDKLVAISASGNSPNVVKAARWVRERGGTVISLVGFDGGELSGLSDVCIHAESPKGKYGPVEDAHMIVDHLITEWMMRDKN